MSLMNNSNDVLQQNISELYKLVNGLQIKLVALESIRTWIPISISIIALLVSVWIFIINNKNTKRTLLRTLLNNFTQAKHNTEEIGIKMASLIGKEKTGKISEEEKTELVILNKTLDSRNDQVLNQIEIACKAYCNKEIIRSEFISELSEDIRRFVEEFPSKYSEPITSYSQTVLFYKTICRRDKV